MTEGARHDRDDSVRGVRPSLLAGIVAVLSIVAYAPGLGGPFIWDDRVLILENPYVHALGWWRRWFVTDFWDVSEDRKQLGQRLAYWRPGTTASYALDWIVGAHDPVYFHAVNLLTNAVASTLAFFALRRWLGGAAIPALLAALLFAVHPTKAESVAWIAGRTDILCAIAIFVACEACARRLATHDRRRRIAFALLEAAATAIAYSVKEQALVLFAFIAVEAWVAIGRPALTVAPLRRISKETIPQVVVAVSYLIARQVWMPIRPPGAVPLPLAARASEFFETMGRFCALLFVPMNLSMQDALVRTHAGKIVFSTGYVILGVVFVLALFVGIVVARKKRPTISAGLALFFVTILPTSNLVSTGMMTMLYDRFLYLPTIGAALAIGSVLEELRADARQRARWIAACSVVVIASVAAAVVGARRSADFSSEKRFWTRELRLHPDSLEALDWFVRRALAERRFHAALALAATAHDYAATEFAYTGRQADFVLDAAELVLLEVPDRHVDTLRSVDAFLSQLLARTEQHAVLRVPDVTLDVPLDQPTFVRRLRAMEPMIIADRADIASRMGDDASAARLIEQAEAKCTACLDITRVAALVHGRAGRYDRANAAVDAVAARMGEGHVAATRKLLRDAQDLATQQLAVPPGPLRLDLRAMELARLEAWGRAYEVLAPYADSLRSAPEMAVAFAELAFRAGEPEVARDVLSATLPPDRIDALEQTWARKMGWTNEGVAVEDEDAGE